MARFGFVGPTYASQSSNVDAQRTVNWYPEVVESGSGKGPLAMYPSPGLKQFCTLDGEFSVPQMFNANGRAFGFANSLWEVFKNGTKINRGALLPAADHISVAYNPQQMLINCVRSVDATTKLFVFTFATNTITEVPQASLKGPFSVIAFSDGYFIGLVQNSAIFQISSLNDGSTWDALDIAEVSEFPDDILWMIVDHREVWLFGRTKSIVYYNSGNPDFPFEPIPGAFIEQGIAIATSPVRADNSVFWIGEDERGALIAWRANGYTPARVSNHSVEYAWSTYAVTDDLTTYTYQDQGHTFWVINFPTANATWVFDIATGMWHERNFLNPATGLPESHRSCCHAYVFGKHLVGDRATGTIYDMSIFYYNDFGNPIRRLRRAPHISTEQMWIAHKHLQVDLEVGLGPIPPLTGGDPDGPQEVYLEAPSGDKWIVTIDDGGILHTDPADPSDTTDATVIVLLDQDDGSYYLVGVDDTGLLITTPVNVYTYTPSAVFNMATSPGNLQSGIQVTDGILQTLEVQPVSRPPQVVLRWSDDGGKTWSNEHIRGAGMAGQYKTRVHWYRLGRSRDRIYEISCTDPVPWRVADAYLEADPGFGPQERLASTLRKGA